jgi:hypothetical protein
MNYKTYQWHACGDLKVIAILWDCKRITQNCVISYANGIFVPKVYIIARRIGFYVNHVYLKQRTYLSSLL